jgi:hypothetical protein
MPRRGPANDMRSIDLSVGAESGRTALRKRLASAEGQESAGELTET